MKRLSVQAGACRIDRQNILQSYSPGDRVPTSPRPSAAASPRHDVDLHGRAANLGLTGRFAGDRRVRFCTADPLLNVRMPGDAAFNLDEGIDMDTYQVNVFVRNLLNRAGIASGTTSMVPLVVRCSSRSNSRAPSAFN
jgi:hypothetical protein